MQGGAGQLCSWVTSNLTWAAGARLELSISNIQQVVTFCLGRDGGGGGIDLKHFPRPSQHGMLALSLTRT